MPTTAYLFNHCSVALPATSSKPNFSGLRESAPCKALCLHCAFNADNNNIIFSATQLPLTPTKPTSPTSISHYLLSLPLALLHLLHRPASHPAQLHHVASQRIHRRRDTSYRILSTDRRCKIGRVRRFDASLSALGPPTVQARYNSVWRKFASVRRDF